MEEHRKSVLCLPSHGPETFENGHGMPSEVHTPSSLKDSSHEQILNRYSRQYPLDILLLFSFCSLYKL